MDFIPKEHKGFTFDEGLEQSFENKWMLNIAHNEVIRMRHNGFFTDTDVKIAKFLFRYTFATEEMLKRYIELQEPDKEHDEKSFEKKLDNLVKNRILNRFMISNYRDMKINKDALRIYCLDVGGKTLLVHYTNEDTNNWYTTHNQKGSEVISNNLITANFFLKLLESCPKKLKYFKLEPEFRIGRTTVVTSFEMGIAIEGTVRYFVGQVVRKSDFPMNFRDKLQKIESILMTNAWKKYFHDSPEAPVLLLITEDDENAIEVAGMITGTTEIKTFRATTDERLGKKLGASGVFLKFDEKENKLKATKTSMFVD